MIVSDVYSDAVEATGLCSQAKVFARLDDAIETLANKGQWNPLIAYMSATVGADNIIDLPDTVEAPLRINIENNPAFPRDQMYEFTMNGPGSGAVDVGWSWTDLDDYTTVNSNSGTVTRRTKRRIQITRPASTVKMLVRLRTIKITGMNSFIPLHSKMAIVMMLKALEAYRRGSPQDFQLGQGFEAQALKFLQEEQQSRDFYKQITKASDQTPIRDYNYTDSDIVVVSDLWDEASEICGGVGTENLYDRISEAVEVLANKGQWDSMTMYLDMVTTGNTVIGLPHEVEIPLRINISQKPALARGRQWEFSVNGPGSDMEEVTTFTWLDSGDSPIVQPLSSPDKVLITSNSSDAGKKITIYGTTSLLGETSEAITLSSTGTKLSNLTFTNITRISKEETQSNVNVKSSDGTVLLASLRANDRESRYRLIKLAKSAESIKIMFRRSSLKVSSLSDMIPLKSRQAILLMLRSLQALRSPEAMTNPNMAQSAKGLEDQALKFLQEEEATRLGYVQASSRDMMPALGVNTHNNGVVIVGDVYDDAADIFGPIGRQRLFDKITDSVEFLANKSQWDGLDGYVDVISDRLGYITLPRYVEVPIEINYHRMPTQMRSKWYEFHLNGMGTHGVNGYFWDDRGQYPLFTDPPNPVNLIAVSSSGGHIDDSVDFRVYGYDSIGNWLQTRQDGDYQDGVIVPVRGDIYEPSPSQPLIAQVTRITKDVSDGYVFLFGVPSGNPPPPPPPPPPIQALPPTLNPPPGHYDNPLFVALLSETGTYLSYTLDGSTPTREHGVLVPHNQTTIFIDRSVTVKAIAYYPDIPNSESTIAGGDYVLDSVPPGSPPVKPAFDPPPGTYETGGDRLFIDVTSTSPAAWLCYTTDGSDPVHNTDPNQDHGKVVTRPEVFLGFRPPITVTLKAISFYPTDRSLFSDIVSGTYVITNGGSPPPSLDPPSMTPTGGTYPERTLITIAHPNAAAYISYTTNGDTPSRTVGRIVPRPSVAVAKSYGEYTFKAMAFIPDDLNSDSSVITEDYVFTPRRPPRDLQNPEPVPVDESVDLISVPMLLGYYAPDETEPLYRRIKTPKWVTWARMRFRKTVRKVTSMYEPLQLKSRMAIVLAMRALAALDKGDLQRAVGFEQKAVQLISEEQQSRNPSETFDLQFDTKTSWADPLQNVRF
jgi:hypothetical protein